MPMMGWSPALVAGLVPVHGGVHDAVVGHRHVMDPELLGSRYVLVDPAHAVEQRVLGVQV
jgi:hypothetical protein